ncbi:MAG: hypothetical protein K2X93_11855 [Candidatus Obscuribacterales bacterium]|nr:hypothetical protein [Candidatus Obscuribacterales bacterium]
MSQLANQFSLSRPIGQVFSQPAPRPKALIVRSSLCPGDVIREEHVTRGSMKCLADNPLTGPFSQADDVIGRVVRNPLPEGTIITGDYLVPLAPAQVSARLGRFWRKCT